MALCPAQVTSRSNGDLLTIEQIADNYHLSTPERMHLIHQVVAEWDAATHGSTERHRAARVNMTRHYATIATGPE